MHSLIVLLLAVAAACAVPRPIGTSTGPSLPQLPRGLGRQELPFLSGYRTPRKQMQNPIFVLDDSPRVVAPADSNEHDWLNKEIDRISQMEENEVLPSFEVELSPWVPQETFIPRPYGPGEGREPGYIPDTIPSTSEEISPLPSPLDTIPQKSPKQRLIALIYPKTSTVTPTIVTGEEKKKAFALTPLDKEYYENQDTVVAPKSDGPHEGGESKSNDAANPIEFQPLRQTRQNPNLGRTKNLVAENLDRLRIGLTQENGEGTDKPGHIDALDPVADPADSIYGIALIAAVGTGLTLAVIGFALGWYTLSKKAKAAADVDYPAYGVTGPTIDKSGDRKLAHSAHMYHYQHQKQQIIAMERSGMEHHNGSVSDPESEEENEEGDYTVYECPGFATTGDMEVKNPLFSENPTPATPGKCELVKPQPKE